MLKKQLFPNGIFFIARGKHSGWHSERNHVKMENLVSGELINIWGKIFMRVIARRKVVLVPAMNTAVIGGIVPY